MVEIFLRHSGPILSCVAALVKSEVVSQGRLRLINLHNFQVNEDFLLSNYS